MEKLAEVTQITCKQWEDFLDEGLIIIDRTEAMMSRMVDLLTARSEAVQVKQGSSKQERNSSGNSCSGKDFSKISGEIEKLHKGYQLKAQHMKEHLQDKIKQSIRRCEEESWEEYTQMTEEYRGQIRQLEEQRRQEGEEEGILFSPPKFRSMGSREFISKVCKSMPMDNVYRGQQVHEMRHESQGEGSQLYMGGNPLLEGDGSDSGDESQSSQTSQLENRENCLKGRKNIAQIGDNLGGTWGNTQIGDNLGMGSRNTQIGDNLGRGQRHTRIGDNPGRGQRHAQIGDNLGVGQIGDNLANTQQLLGLLQQQGEMTQGLEQRMLNLDMKVEDNRKTMRCNSGKHAKGRGHKKKKKNKYSSSSESSSSDSESSSSSSSSEDSSSSSSSSEGGRKKRYKKKKGSKQGRRDYLLKNLQFTGDGKLSWDNFIFQFERVAKEQKWSKRKEVSKFLDCLSEKALDYARKMDEHKSYRKLKAKMADRFDIRTDPSITRKELQTLKMVSEESLENFAQRVLFLTMDAFPGAKEGTIQQMAIEVFLRGVTDKDAARSASDKCPKTLSKALKYVKRSICT